MEIHCDGSNKHKFETHIQDYYTDIATLSIIGISTICKIFRHIFWARHFRRRAGAELDQDDQVSGDRIDELEENHILTYCA